MQTRNYPVITRRASTKPTATLLIENVGPSDLRLVCFCPCGQHRVPQRERCTHSTNAGWALFFAPGFSPALLPWLTMFVCHPPVITSESAHADERGICGCLRTRLHALQPKLRELLEMPRPRLDLASRHVANAFEPKALDGKASHDRPVHHRAPQHRVVHARSRCEIAHEPAGETIARPGGIVHFLQRKRRHGTNSVVVHHHCAVFASFDS